MIRKAFPLFLIILFPLNSFSQELEMIYEKTMEALGGEDVWENVSSVYSYGTWNFPDGEDIPFIYRNLNPDMARFDFDDSGTRYSYSNYGRKGWTSSPDYFEEIQGSVDGKEAILIRHSFLYTNNLIGYKEKGLELEFDGSIQYMDKEVWLIRVLGFENREELYYISKDDYLPFIKQTYIESRGREIVVNYNIRGYNRVRSLLLPSKIMVSSDVVNLSINYSTYVLNRNMDKEYFRDPNEIDYTTNTLSLTKEEAQDYIHTRIPITKAMGFEVERLTTDEVSMTAPIAANVNHLKSAFGGSVDSLFLTVGWTYIRLLIDHIEPTPVIIGNKGATTFQRPITDDFRARIEIPSSRTIKDFLKVFDREGKARISLNAIIEDQGKTYATFEGNYVVVKRE